MTSMLAHVVMDMMATVIRPLMFSFLCLGFWLGSRLISGLGRDGTNMPVVNALSLVLSSQEHPDLLRDGVLSTLSNQGSSPKMH